MSSIYVTAEQVLATPRLTTDKEAAAILKTDDGQPSADQRRLPQQPAPATLSDATSAAPIADRVRLTAAGSAERGFLGCYIQGGSRLLMIKIQIVHVF